jgi:hypothetical protein
MATLLGQFCRALVAQVLLVDYILCAEMSKYCGCCGKFVWPNGDPPEDWEVSWEPKLSRARGLRILWLDAGPSIVKC